MKRITLLLVAAITVVACGKGDDKNESNTKKFNPPAWIQGTWLDSNNIGYKFEVNDFCVIVPTQEICYNQGIFATEVTDVKEEKTDNIYKTKTDIYQKTFTNRIKNDMICINRFTKRINFILRFIALYFIE